ncbi:MAG: MATE family efflux transporter [Lachnospiraceae bacterium]|nr:MATE family efflux transporter [Lachnospiraceae bacterium]
MGASAQKKIGLDLTEGSILRGLLVFAVPIVLTNIIQQFYSLVDLMVVGQFVGSTGTAGVSSGGEIADLVTPVATAFASAGQIYIAQLVGAKQIAQTKKSAGTLITLMLLMSLVFMVITLVFCTPILKLINCPEEAFDQARAYMLITAFGMPFIYGYNAVCGILRGMGESRRPLIFISVAAVTNIVLDVILVAVFKLEAAGTAVATTMAQVGSFVAAFYFMYKHKENFDFELKLSYFKIDPHSAEVILKQGLPQAIRSMLVRFSLLWVNANINSYGLTATATNGVGNKLQKFLDVFTTGLNQASSAMVGQNLGAKKQDRASKTVWCTLRCTLVVATCLTAMSLLIPRQVFGIFTKDEAVLEMGVFYMHMLIAHFFCSAVVTAFQSMVLGSGYASMNFMIGILDGVICKVGLSLIFVNIFNMGVYGYFWAVGFSRALPAVICFIFFMSGKWKTRKLLTD